MGTCTWQCSQRTILVGALILFGLAFFLELNKCLKIQNPMPMAIINSKKRMTNQSKLSVGVVCVFIPETASKML